MKDLILSEFLENYPEFSNAAAYPKSRIEHRLKMAVKFFADVPFYDEETKKHVQGLYVAHFVSVAGPLTPGASKMAGTVGLGLVSSKSVDGASIAYDNSIAQEEGAGFWNATAYGRELWQLMQLFGAGGYQV
ncbi:MAG TPA: DUF4054 domain-containing protein [Candidatus Aphodousia gallistercoris]|nr:DUF4054 domain-containing protein [Candidatus Aphodousia gallistercoris]